MAKFDKNKLEFIYHRDAITTPTFEWYEVMHEGVKVLEVRRKEDFPHRWVATDNDGKQCFEANQYRNDLFEQIVYEGVFE